MVVTFTRLRGRLAAALTSLVMAVSPALAQTPTDPNSLAEAWLAGLEADNTPVIWSHSVALRHETAAGLPAHRTRLVEELNTLVISARVAGNTPLASGLARWVEALGADDPQLARTPGRFDLPWLGANLRQDVPLTTLAHWGICEVPDWVEVWSLSGVERMRWWPGLDLAALIAELPSTATQRADRAAVIGPFGQVRQWGIAAWNRETAPLAPGSRVMVQLPSRQGLRDALPFPGTTVESELINERLPGYLATRLPGDECDLSERKPR